MKYSFVSFLGSYQNDTQAPQIAAFVVTAFVAAIFGYQHRFKHFRRSVLQREARCVQELLRLGFQASESKVHDFQFGVLIRTLE